MHSKSKGGLGVAKVIEFMIKHEIPVFSEVLCDNSEFDLIVDTKAGLKTIQVRTSETTDGAVSLSLRSVTPGTRKSACKVKRFSDKIDVFSLYVKDKDVLLFIDGHRVSDLNNRVFFRFTEPKTRNSGIVRMAKDFMIPSFLRKEEDMTQYTNEELFKELSSRFHYLCLVGQPKEPSENGFQLVMSQDYYQAQRAELQSKFKAMADMLGKYKTVEAMKNSVVRP